MRKFGFTLVELLVLIIIIVILAAVLLPSLVGDPGPMRRASCANNLKMMGLICKMYSNETKGGLYPRVQGDPPWGGDNPPPTGCTNVVTQFEFGPKCDSIYPEYMTDPSVLVCPMATYDKDVHILDQDWNGTCRYRGFIAHPSATYFYFGYVLDQCGDSDPKADILGKKGPAQFVAMIESLKGAMTDGDPATDGVLNDDVTVAAPNGNVKGDTIHRLREGVERVLATDTNNPAAVVKVQSTIAMMWDQIHIDPSGDAEFNHVPGGCNVLYMDGCVEFLKYPGRFPASTAWAQFISTLSDQPPR